MNSIAKVKKVFHGSEPLLIVFFLALFIFFSNITEYFFQVNNIMLMLLQTVELGLLTLAMSVSVISGGRDLSIGAIASMSTVFLGFFMGTLKLDIGLAIMISFVIAVGIGILNGYLIGHLKVVSILATIGTQSVCRGIGLITTSGKSVSMDNKVFNFIGQHLIGGVVPFQIIILIVAIIITSILLLYSKWGRRVYMIGVNPEAARFAGINVKKNLLLVYVFSSIMAFLCGLVMASRLSSGRADVADPLVLKALSATMLGGISLKGGQGRITGAVLGVAVFAIISNGLSMMNISSFLEQVIVGVILLGVLVIQQYRKAPNAL